MARVSSYSEAILPDGDGVEDLNMLEDDPRLKELQKQLEATNAKSAKKDSKGAANRCRKEWT